MKQNACRLIDPWKLFVVGLMLFPRTVGADIGDTREQCDSQYGKPTAVYTKAELERPGMLAGGAPQLIAWKAAVVCLYAPTATCRVAAWFVQSGDKLVCNALFFSSYNLADKLQEKRLTSPAKGIKWNELRDARQSYKEYASREYARSDAKALATVIERLVDGKPLYELIVFSSHF